MLGGAIEQGFPPFRSESHPKLGSPWRGRRAADRSCALHDRGATKTQLLRLRLRGNREVRGRATLWRGWTSRPTVGRRWRRSLGGGSRASIRRVASLLRLG